MKDKIEQSLQRIRKQYERYGLSVYVAHSGGKDSCVILDLTLQVVTSPRIIHNIKKETHPLTEKFLSELNKTHVVWSVSPENMEQFVKDSLLRSQIDGSRIDECDRTDRSDNFIVDGQSVNRLSMTEEVENGIFGLHICYPIYDWTDAEVWEYIRSKEVAISLEYFTEEN